MKKFIKYLLKKILILAKFIVKRLPKKYQALIIKGFNRLYLEVNHNPINLATTPPIELSFTTITEKQLNNHLEFVERTENKPLENVKIALWFIPYIENVNGGGISTIYRFANHLSLKKNIHNIFCCYPRIDKHYIRVLENQILKKYPDLSFEVMTLLNLSEQEINKLPQADIAISTLWIDGYPLIAYNNCQKKYSLFQDVEDLFYISGSVSMQAKYVAQVKGIHKFTNSQGLAKMIEQTPGDTFVYSPGVDETMFYPEVNKKDDVIKIVFYGRPSIQRNAFEFTVNVLAKIKELYGNAVQIFSIGENWDVRSYPNLKNAIIVKGHFTNLKEMAHFIRGCHIGMPMITTPTISYQHLEYASSGLAIVTLEHLGTTSVFTHNENALILPPIEDVFVNHISNLIENKDELKRLSTAANELTKNMIWEKCNDSVVEFLTK